MLLNTPQFMLAGLEPPPGPGPRAACASATVATAATSRFAARCAPRSSAGESLISCAGTDGLQDPFELPDRFYEWLDPYPPDLPPRPDVKW
ncbi:MAG: hypothetical protein MZW92_31695 [Comamonadaceae bacterium]|nr:hypothetical protein [Comamonadaceae bacterium]